jgi:hypothetical protein
MGDQRPALLPNPEVIADLIRSGMTPETIVLVINEDKKRKLTYALVSSVMGGVCFLAIVLGFIYLVVHGNYKSASGLLATGVLAIIRDMLKARL